MPVAADADVLLQVLCAAGVRPLHVGRTSRGPRELAVYLHAPDGLAARAMAVETLNRTPGVAGVEDNPRSPWILYVRLTSGGAGRPGAGPGRPPA